MHACCHCHCLCCSERTCPLMHCWCLSCICWGLWHACGAGETIQLSDISRWKQELCGLGFLLCAFFSSGFPAVHPASFPDIRGSFFACSRDKDAHRNLSPLRFHARHKHLVRALRSPLFFPYENRDLHYQQGISFFMWFVNVYGGPENKFL